MRAECGLRIGREGETPALNVLETVVHGDCECRAGEREKDGREHGETKDGQRRSVQPIGEV